jgi:Kef-type K+ transport system membrane component KefB/nucleotide-binding universal stress UspA family protein
LRLLLIVVLLLPMIIGVGHAAPTHDGGGAGGTDEAILLAQLALLLLIGRGLGELMQRLGQPAVIGQLLAGLILGASLVGWRWPEAQQMIFPRDAAQKNLVTGVADIGVLMLLLLTGMEIDLGLARKVGRPAVAVAAAGVAVPFACGVALGEILPTSILPDSGGRLVASLFLGTALSISSIKIVAMVVRDMNFMRRDLGQIIVASAIMEDTAGWIIIAIILGVAGASGVAPAPLARTVLGTAIFLVLSFTLGRRLVFRLIRSVNDHCVGDDMVITAILVVMLVLALITQLIGVNTVLGAFVAGVLVGESPILSGQIENGLRGFVTAFLMPVFFGLSGLSADLTIFRHPGFVLLTLGLVAIASFGKFAGAFLGSRLGGLSARQALALGCAMNARGSTEVIIATIGLSMGVLTQNLYTMILTMAVITTMAMPPMLRWALARLPLEEDEQARLESEEVDASGFIADRERLLVAADESANGILAARFAGFLAGQRGFPMTVLNLRSRQAEATARREPSGATEVPLAAAAMEGAKLPGNVTDDGRGQGPHAVEVIARIETEDAAAAVASEAEKGFGLLFIGLARMCDADGGLLSDVNRIAGRFKGPIALVIAAQAERLRPEGRVNVLVPVNGTEASNCGAEIAFALLPSKGSMITALHVSEQNGLRHRSGAGRTDQSIRANMTRLADRYGFVIDTVVRFDAVPQEAILEEATRRNADLLVIGASKRVGDVFYLGKTASALLAHWRGNLVLLAV